MFSRSTKVLVLVVAALMIPAMAGAQAKSKLSSGSYAGKIHPTDASDSSSDTKITFRVNRTGTKITRLKAQFYYLCIIGGVFSLQSYMFPSFHKGAIKVRRNGTFSARDVVDREAGFIVKFNGKVKGRTRAKGALSLNTAINGSGCGRDLTWSAKRK
ncbi:MAG: hypothetical protein JJE13_08080 [Thermoleophilia bacterium]|nr:hypothetical protein [Thermoleophilia bacterium]